jgi:hypothetical protein
MSVNGAVVSSAALGVPAQGLADEVYSWPRLGVGYRREAIAGFTLRRRDGNAW